MPVAASSPVYLPGGTLTVKRSFRVLPSDKSTSTLPAVVCISSSPSNGSAGIALHPDRAVSISAFYASVVSTGQVVFSDMIVQPSAGTYSSFTSSCSRFSSESPWLLTVLVHSAVSFLLFAFGSSDSTSGLTLPSTIVKCTFSVVEGVPLLDGSSVRGVRGERRFVRERVVVSYGSVSLVNYLVGDRCGVPLGSDGDGCVFGVLL